MQKIFRAMKKYGLILSTMCPGNILVSGSYDVRWNNDVMNPAFNSLNAWDFEVIELGRSP